MLTGFKTVGIGAAMVILPSLTEYANLIDWSFLGPKGALVASGLTMIGLRLLTSTPVFQRKQ